MLHQRYLKLIKPNPGVTKMRKLGFLSDKTHSFCVKEESRVTPEHCPRCFKAKLKNDENYSNCPSCADSEKRDFLEWRARIWKYLDGDKIFSVKAF